MTLSAVTNIVLSLRSSSVSVTIMENGGPNQLVTVVHALGNNILYEMINPSTAFYIESGIHRPGHNDYYVL